MRTRRRATLVVALLLAAPVCAQDEGLGGGPVLSGYGDRLGGEPGRDDGADPVGTFEPTEDQDDEPVRSSGRSDEADAAPNRGTRRGNYGSAKLLGHYLNDEELGERPDVPTAPQGGGSEDPAQAVDEALDNDASQDAMGEHQRDRVRPAFDALSDDEQARFNELLEGETPEVQAQLIKALAAGNEIDALEDFQEAISGQDAEWMRENLRVTGAGEDGTGDGLAQQFSHTCGVTTVQALRASYDPVYALDLNQNNTDLHAYDGADPEREGFNEQVAMEQRTLTEAPYSGDSFGPHSGVAVGRDQTGGSGRWVDDRLNELEESTGLTYTTEQDPSAADAVSSLRENLEAGRMVPTVVGGSAGSYAHYVLAMDVRENDDGAREYLFHDPAAGYTSWVSEASILDGTMRLNDDIASYDTITALEVPSADEDEGEEDNG